MVIRKALLVNYILIQVEVCQVISHLSNENLMAERM